MEDLVNKNSSFADFVSFRRYTYARTHKYTARTAVYCGLTSSNASIMKLLGNFFTALYMDPSVKRKIIRSRPTVELNEKIAEKELQVWQFI